MPERGNAFLANPTVFLAANAIGVQQVDVAYAPPNWQNVDDATYNFSIRDAVGDNIPRLRMENPIVPFGVEVVVAKWCNTSQGVHAGRYDEISYCDFFSSPSSGRTHSGFHRRHERLRVRGCHCRPCSCRWVCHPCASGRSFAAISR